ncbi:hypothetical protein V6N13_106034 [Hibiscus sabdariffa]
MAMCKTFSSVSFFFLLYVIGFVSVSADAAVKRYQFDIQVKNVSRLCHAKPIVTVNGMFPGPTIYAREGDRVLINVTNHAQYNMSIHWHGLKQLRNGWADGPAYITQCPIQSGRSYTYDFNVTGEWWNNDVEEIVKQGNKLGLPPNTSDAHTINGKPGPLFPCSEKRQTTNVLVQANRAPGRYFMAARPFMDAPLTVDNKTATAILQYKGVPNTVVPILPQLPFPNDTAFALSYNAKLRSLNSPLYAANVPLKVDRHLFYTIGLGINQCATCLNGTQLTASLNNITFVMPRIGLLQAHYFNIKGVFTTDFPDRPPKPFNYTGAPLTANLGTTLGTRLSKIAFNSTVELVLQDTNLLTVESHPFHLHGYNFFVVGTGIGNFDPAKDPAKYNLIDPPERNTVGVPTGGWTAIRFRADNPGVWFMHCHLELHTGWGLKTAFVVENGKGPNQSILPPPNDLPPC